MARARLAVMLMLGMFLLLGGMLALTADAFTTDGQTDLISCHDSMSDSIYGSSTWSWLPPGKVCHYPDGSSDRPHWRGELASLVAVLLGAALFGGTLVRPVRAPPEEPERELQLA
jgi:hypothetical protein